MNVEDNLDSDTFYDFWQLSGCDVVLCRNSGHISKITTNNRPFYSLFTQKSVISVVQHDVA